MKAKVAVAAVVVIGATGLATGMAMSGQGRDDAPPMPWENDPSITAVCVAIAAPAPGRAPGKGNENGTLIDDQGREVWVWMETVAPIPPDPPSSDPPSPDPDSPPVYDDAGREYVRSESEPKGGLDLAAEKERCEPNTPPRRDGEGRQDGDQ